MTRTSTRPDVDVLVFDLLGTVLDEDAGMAGAVERATAGSAVDRGAFQVAWTARIESLLAQVHTHGAAYRTLDEIQQQALEELLGEHRLSLPTDVVRRLARFGHRIDPFPDSVAAIDRLACSTAVVALTNAGAAQAFEMSAGAGLRWSTLVSAQTVRTYKPDPRMYAHVVDRLEVDPSRALFVAAHPWDLDGAARQGFRTAYVDRAGSPPGRLAGHAGRYDLVVPDLSALADLLGPDDGSVVREP